MFPLKTLIFLFFQDWSTCQMVISSVTLLSGLSTKVGRIFFQKVIFTAFRNTPFSNFLIWRLFHISKFDVIDQICQWAFFTFLVLTFLIKFVKRPSSSVPDPRVLCIRGVSFKMLLKWLVFHWEIHDENALSLRNSQWKLEHISKSISEEYDAIKLIFVNIYFQILTDT